MVKKEGGYKVPDELKKTCPACGERIAKQGWNMHWKFKHADIDFVSFDEAKADKTTAQKPNAEEKKGSGDSSFREGESGREEGGSGSDSDSEFWGDD